MVDSDDAKPTDDKEHSEAGRKSDDGLADGFEVYEMLPAEEPEMEMGAIGVFPGGSAEAADRWFFAAGGRGRQGPVSFSALKQKAARGELAREDLVWREGMPKWKRAGDAAGLFGDQPARLGPQPPRLPEKAGTDGSGILGLLQTVVAGILGLLQTVRAWPSSSGSLRLCGYVAAGLAGLTLVISLLLSYWHYTWFPGVVLFLLVFIVCQAAAAVLDAVHRLEAEVSARSKPRDESPAEG